MLCKSKSFGRDVGVDLCWCCIPVFEDVVFVVQFGESLGQKQLVPETLVDPEGQLAWHHLASQHPGGKCSRGGFLFGKALGEESDDDDPGHDQWRQELTEALRCW
ncbi:hypothetical protein ACFV5G_38520 [Streptomyces sp. NPDC059766]|uniref:hypothetical protein n=1 Tax=Streptomyces sp. NPDC059766 TaxID=3346940 RepID=UPI00365871DE